MKLQRKHKKIISVWSFAKTLTECQFRNDYSSCCTLPLDKQINIPIRMLKWMRHPSVEITGRSLGVTSCQE